VVARDILGELSRDRVEEGGGPIGDRVELAEVLSVETKDLTLSVVDSGEVVGLDIFKDSLWHTADEHIETEVSHHLAVSLIAEGLTGLEGGAEERDRRLVAESPAELLVVHREHIDTHLLARDNNLLTLLADRDEGASLDIVVAVVGDEVLDSLTGEGAELDLVENDDRLTLVESDVIDKLELEEDIVDIGEILEEVEHGRRGGGEVDEDEGLVFVACELDGESRFADAAGALYEHSGVAAGLLLPLKKLSISLTLENYLINCHNKK
jgi:hypothetical protein